MSWFKIYNFKNLFRQAAPKNAHTFDGYLPYGHDDNFPISWSEAISSSPSATSCLGTIQDFIEGHKFSDDNLGKTVVNAHGETLWQIHQKASDSLGEFEGFALLVRYNALAQVTEIRNLPFENCRLGKPDDNGYISKIYVNPFFGTPAYAGADKKLTKVYDAFNPDPLVIKKQIADQKTKYKGQILYFGTTSTRSRYYPMPKAVSSLKWMKIEAGVSDYHEDNLTNGFLQPFMLVMKGNPGDPSSNPEYSDHNGEGKPATVAQEFDEVISENFMGAKRVGNMFVQWVNNNDEVPTAVALPANNNGDLFITLDNQSTKKITVAWKVPSILANINEGVSLGGDGNQVRVSVKLMQHRVIKEQKYLTDTYEKLMRLWSTPYAQPISIVPFNPYPELEIIDAQIWDALSSEEKRLWIEKHTDVELIEAEVSEPIEEPTQQNFTNALPVKFPEAVVNKVKKTIEYRSKMGIECGGKAGWGVADSISNGQNMGLRQLKRIHSYLKKNDKYANSPYSEGCDAILYNAWGGKDMFNFLEQELKRYEQWLNKTN